VATPSADQSLSGLAVLTIRIHLYPDAGGFAPTATANAVVREVQLPGELLDGAAGAPEQRDDSPARTLEKLAVQACTQVIPSNRLPHYCTRKRELLK
jgi:hypothetical protein